MDKNTGEEQLLDLQQQQAGSQQTACALYYTHTLRKKGQPLSASSTRLVQPAWLFEGEMKPQGADAAIQAGSVQAQTTATGTKLEESIQP